MFENGGAPTPLSDCNMACAGNSSEFCGGPNRLNVSFFYFDIELARALSGRVQVYNFTGTLSGEPTGGNGNQGGGNSDVGPVTSGLPAPWTYAACYV